ncbi:MAG: DEAD/DEAH box helicase, partial [Actinomycetota bacterium]|nr:DEAD/DEAH box helicase [Actinomycetota bacterium]
MDEDQLDAVADFAALGLRPELLRALSGLGYEEPTPIQREAIRPLIAGHDLVGQAATGTGKTAAFALPLLQKLGPETQSGPPAQKREPETQGGPPAQKCEPEAQGG